MAGSKSKKAKPKKNTNKDTNKDPGNNNINNNNNIKDSGGGEEGPREPCQAEIRPPEEFLCVKYTTEFLIFLSIWAEIAMLVMLFMKTSDIPSETTGPSTDIFVVAPLWVKLVTCFVIVWTILGMAMTTMENFTGCLIYCIVMWIVVVFNTIRIHHDSVLWWVSVAIHIAGNMSSLFFLFELNKAYQKGKNNNTNKK